MKEFEKARTVQPDGWHWRELGPQGPSWYPSTPTGPVDRASEHLVLEAIWGDRESFGEPLAWAGFDAEDALVVELADNSPETLAAVELLTGSSFEAPGDTPSFELAWAHAASTANREYANPRWRAVDAAP